MGALFGTGSWTDDAYVGRLYPHGTPAKARLRQYAEQFDFVEVNSTYYATPKREVVASWVEQTRPGFLFHLKLHRTVAQSPFKAATEGKAVDRLLAAAQPVIKAKRLGAFLLVLPPMFGPERHRLDELIPLADKLSDFPLAIELRHRGWVDGPRRRRETLDFFREHELVWVAVDMPQIAESTIMPPLDEVTHPHLAYLRLHGRNRRWLKAKSAAERHLHDYTSVQLTALRRRIGKLEKHADTVFVVANNHARDFAPKTALALKNHRR